MPWFHPRPQCTPDELIAGAVEYDVYKGEESCHSETVYGKYAKFYECQRASPILLGHEELLENKTVSWVPDKNGTEFRCTCARMWGLDTVTCSETAQGDEMSYLFAWTSLIAIWILAVSIAQMHRLFKNESRSQHWR